MTARDIPVIPTILVAAAIATMIALGIWQLGRADEKEALIAKYEAAQATNSFSTLLPDDPEAAYTLTIDYCRGPIDQRATAGRNSLGQNGWAHVARCNVGTDWPRTEDSCNAQVALLYDHYEAGNPESKADYLASCMDPTSSLKSISDVVREVEVVMGWSQTPAPVLWDGGFFAGTVVPSGELGFKIVADPPLAGLEANAKPDPKDLPNNHLAYAGQWFFFALTALVIYIVALRKRTKDAKRT